MVDIHGKCLVHGIAHIELVADNRFSRRVGKLHTQRVLVLGRHNLENIVSLCTVIGLQIPGLTGGGFFKTHPVFYPSFGDGNIESRFRQRVAAHDGAIGHNAFVTVLTAHINGDVCRGNDNIV